MIIIMDNIWLSSIVIIKKMMMHLISVLQGSIEVPQQRVAQNATKK